MCFDDLLAHVRETTLLHSTADALEWDERTGLPVAAQEYRADQVTLLRGLVHRRRTDPQVGHWLEKLLGEGDTNDDRESTIQRLYKDYQRDLRMPQTLVESLARATMRGQQTWDTARRNNDYAAFRPALDEILHLKRQQANCLAEEGQSLYDALLDEYEPGAKAVDLQTMFADLRESLGQLIAKVQGAQRQPDVSILERKYEIEAQKKISRMAAEKIGFDFRRGRLDETSHPFCTTLGPDDCRILTRYESNWFPGGLFGTLHEAGHGLYEQGLKREWYGLPPGSFVSLGMHESQSRLWENLVGRSKSFWDYFFPIIKQAFPGTLADVSVADFHFAVNTVRPSLIRVEADEATYNLHIIVRFELEKALLEGDLSTQDLPHAWNQKYRDVVGISPDSDTDGVLQDVHWGAGLIGYFPTYSLGNIYGAQLYEAAERQLGDLQPMFLTGDFQPLLKWLQSNVHEHGQNLDPSKLIERATGAPPTSEPLIRSLTDRYAKLYGFV